MAQSKQVKQPQDTAHNSSPLTSTGEGTSIPASIDDKKEPKCGRYMPHAKGKSICRPLQGIHHSLNAPDHLGAHRARKASNDSANNGHGRALDPVTSASYAILLTTEQNSLAPHVPTSDFDYTKPMPATSSAAASVPNTTNDDGSKIPQPHLLCPVKAATRQRQ
jgi:hypothetical protein